MVINQMYKDADLQDPAIGHVLHKTFCTLQIVGGRPEIDTYASPSRSVTGRARGLPHVTRSRVGSDYYRHHRRRSDHHLSCPSFRKPSLRDSTTDVFYLRGNPGFGWEPKTSTIGRPKSFRLWFLYTTGISSSSRQDEIVEKCFR